MKCQSARWKLMASSRRVSQSTDEMIVYITSCVGGRHNMPRPLQVDLRPFNLESGVRVTCDVGYLCGNFSLPRPLCSRLRPNYYVYRVLRAICCQPVGRQPHLLHVSAVDRRQTRRDVRDRETDVRRASSLNAPCPRGGGITNCTHTRN